METPFLQALSSHSNLIRTRPRPIGPSPKVGFFFTLLLVFSISVIKIIIEKINKNR
jgi:hypothetical protein